MTAMTSRVLALVGARTRRNGDPVGIRRRLPEVLAAAATAGYLTHGVLPRALETWGAAGSEVSMPLPGDELIPQPDNVQTMAVTVSAPRGQVWPWLVQMGVDRAGLYSYTWVENGLLHLGVANAHRIHPEWQDLQVGDIIAFTPRGYPGGRRGPRVVQLESDHHLVLDLSPGARPGKVTGPWQFVLHDASGAGTRLLLRTRTGPGRPTALRVIDFLLRPGYLVMDRAMLLSIKQRAEGGAKKSSRPAVG
ncbi:hypothetical protein [Arthrobacter globiformis]|uniref:hypothetical protein n=1 Tax=Arthrobacter globiformis TaxID=1665 RepID=UPI00209BD536|nr:hypothetical protein [Arthrobacter globiformis]